MDDQEHIDLEDQIYAAEILLEKRPEIHNKIHTTGSLEKFFKLSIKDILRTRAIEKNVYRQDILSGKVS